MADEKISEFIDTRRATISPSADLTDETAAALLRTINSNHARNPVTLDGVYIFPGTLSNQAIDFYGTRMAPSSLKNYLRNVKSGIALMNSHRTGGGFGSGELPVGRIFDGEISGDPIKAKRGAPFDDAVGASLGVWNYMLRGIQVTDVPNDSLIASVDGGTTKDMSISFSIRPDGQYVCSVCGNNYLNYEECQHLVFNTYENDAGEGQRAFAWVEGGNALEGSLVYAGATPGAMVRKARQLVNTMSKEMIGWMEDRYQCRLLDASVHPVQKLAAEADTKTTKEVDSMDIDRNALATTLQLLVPDQAGDIMALEDDSDCLVAGLDALSRCVEEASERVDAQMSDAELGRAYRSDLIESAVSARVRAQGDAFDADRYRAALEKSGDLDFIKGERETWEIRSAEVLRGGPGQHRQKDRPEINAPAGAYQ